MLTVAGEFGEAPGGSSLSKCQSCLRKAFLGLFPPHWLGWIMPGMGCQGAGGCNATEAAGNAIVREGKITLALHLVPISSPDMGWRGGNVIVRDCSFLTIICLHSQKGKCFIILLAIKWKRDLTLLFITGLPNVIEQSNLNKAKDVLKGEGLESFHWKYSQVWIKSSDIATDPATDIDKEMVRIFHTPWLLVLISQILFPR